VLGLRAAAAQVAADSIPQPSIGQGFIENRGQWRTAARYVSNFGELTVRCETGSIVLQHECSTVGESRVGVVRLVFDETLSVEPRGVKPTPATYNFFLGPDPTAWRTDVRSYSTITYSGVAAGADVRLYGFGNHLEYDVLLAESTPTEVFVVRCDGVTGLAVEPTGELRLDTLLGPIFHSRPIARQITADSKSIPATCAFRIVDANHFGFTVPDRIAGSSLVIDPGVTWATFIGGSADDHPGFIQELPSGHLLIAGRSQSPDYPTTSGVFANTAAGSSDVVVTCLDPSGSSLIFSTYVGGSGVDVPDALAVSSVGQIVVGGSTDSTDYPTLPNAYDPTFNGGLFDGFVSVLNPDGSGLLLSTYLGGSCNEFVHALGFTSTGRVVVAGNTCSPNFPSTSSAFDPSFGGQADGILCWFDASQSGPSQLVASTFLGSTGADQIFDLEMAPNDEPIVVGTSSSPDFPATAGSYDETLGGSFISRLAADGSALIESTHFKGGNPLRVMLDGQTIVIAGTPNLTLPVTPEAFDPDWNGQNDAFVARFDDQLTTLLAATYLGGSRMDNPHGLAVDESGNVVIVGYTESDDYPTTAGAYDTVKGGPTGTVTSMVSCLSADLSELVYSSFLGPAMAASSWANDVVALGTKDVVIVGEGAQTGFPVTPGAFDETFNGGTLGGADGYVARMLLKPSTWYSLGGSVPGSNGTPALAGSGDLIGGQPVALALTNAKPATPATLIIGLSLLNAPFKGGTLVPNPNLMLFGLPTNGHGALTLNATWPSGLPSGFSFFTQFWIPDAAAPAGLAASNGLAGTTP
jgi:hypothetical protein